MPSEVVITPNMRERFEECRQFAAGFEPKPYEDVKRALDKAAADTAKEAIRDFAELMEPLARRA